MRIKRFQKFHQYIIDVYKKFQKYFYLFENIIVQSFRRRSFFGIGRFIRENGSLAVIVLIATLITFGNISAKSNNDDTFLVGHWSSQENKMQKPQTQDESGVLLDGGLVGDTQTYITTLEDKESGVVSTELSILTNTDEELLGDTAIIPPRRADASDPENEGDVVLYTVKTGDTLGTIAQAHGVTISTLFWANEIEDVNDIKPGDTIFILPVSGLKYKIKSGDTIEKIAKDNEIDRKEIIAYNDLPANGELVVGEEIIIPGAQKDIPEPEPDPIFAPREYVATGNGSTNLGSKIVSSGKIARKGGNSFPYGYCTYYVANKRNVTWRGNAGAWLYNARAAGMKTGKKPKVGAIVVTTEDSRYGHVAYVEKVGKGTITVSEMNYKGWGVVNRRTLSQNARVIRGYIY